MKVKPKISESATAKKKRYEGFTGEEKSAMQERVREQKVRGKADGESELLAIWTVSNNTEKNRTTKESIAAETVVARARAPSGEYRRN